MTDAPGADMLVARRVAPYFDCALLEAYMRARDTVEAVATDARVELEFCSLDQQMFVLAVALLVCLVARRKQATQMMVTQLVE